MRVTNPLSAELSELRRSLVPGLLGALRFNLNREAAAFHAFEIGKVFAMRDGAPRRARAARRDQLWRLRAGRGRQAGRHGELLDAQGRARAMVRRAGRGGARRIRSAGETAYRFLHPGRAARVHARRQTDRISRRTASGGSDKSRTEQPLRAY